MKKFKEYKLKVTVHLDQDDQELLGEAWELYKDDLDSDICFEDFINMLLQVGSLGNLRDKAYQMLCARAMGLKERRNMT